MDANVHRASQLLCHMLDLGACPTVHRRGKGTGGRQVSVSCHRPSDSHLTWSRRQRGGSSPGLVGHRDPTRRFHCWSSPRGTRQAHCWTRHASQRAHFWARALLHGRSIAGPAARARGGGWSGIRGRSSAMRDAAATRGAATAAARIQTVGAHRARSSQSFFFI